MALVIKKWHASKLKANQKGNYVHLMGREGGLMAWILSLIGIDPVSEVEIKGDLIKFTNASLAGKETRIIPMRSVTSAYYAYEKPWKNALILGVVLMPLMLSGLLIGPLYYYLNKSLSVGVVEKSGWTGSFSFKRSIIEGENIEEEEAYEVVEIIRSLVEAKTA